MKKKKQERVYALRISKKAWELRDEVYKKVVQMRLKEGKGIPTKADAYEHIFRYFLNK